MRNPVTTLLPGQKRILAHFYTFLWARHCTTMLVLIALFTPTPAKAQSVIYLECNEEIGIRRENINITAFGKNGLETQHQERPPKLLEANQLRTHKVTLNPAAASGNWRSDSSPRYYPTHISFSESNYPASEILKISREKGSSNSTSFMRISSWMSSTPFPIKKEQYVEIQATGTCRILPIPKNNLF